jgi:hypothetical protein
LSTQPVVTIVDSGGNPTTSGDTVTLSIATGPPGAALTCNGGSASQVASSGVATFSGCQVIGRAGTYTLGAAANDPVQGALTSATSNSFSIATGAPSKLVFTVQPGDGKNAALLSAQPVVTIEDSGGNPTTSGDTVTLSIATGPSGATLACTGGTSKAASAGVATFSGCQIVGPIGTYTLTATDSSSGSVTPATSLVFNLTFGAPTQLVFTTQPGSGPTGTVLSPQPVVTIEDSGGNTVTTATDTVTLTILSPPSAGTISCTGGTSMAAIGGVATFSGCQITGLPVVYTIGASDPPLSGATATVIITP